MPPLARNGQLGKRDVLKSVWQGEDLLVVCVGQAEMPVAKVMRKKLTVEDIKEAYGDVNVYLWNKNLQSFPRRVRGGIIYIEAEGVIAVVIDHRYGVLAYVMVLHPVKRKGEKLVVDMRMKGCFLDIVVGCPPLPLDQKFRARGIDASTGHVLKRTDDYGFIKMNIEGPDILKVDDTFIPEDVKELLQENPLAMLETSTLQQTTKRRKLNNERKSPKASLAVVPVVYVYRAMNKEHGEEKQGYKFIERHMVEGEDKISWAPVHLVPIGGQYCHPKRKPSNRYVDEHSDLLMKRFNLMLLTYGLDTSYRILLVYLKRM